MAKNPLLVKIRNLPYKIYGNIRFVDNNEPSCFVNSFPKSGTHLLSQVLMNQKSLETMEDLLPWRLQLDLKREQILRF